MKGLARLFTRYTSPDYKEGKRLIHQNNRGDVCIAQALPPLSELVRLGCGWFYNSGNAPIATAIPADGTIAHPTLILWNGESPNGKCYIIHLAGFSRVNSGAIETTASVGVQVSLSNPLIAPSLSIGGPPLSLSGKFKYDGKAVLGTNIVGSASGSDPINAEAFHQIGTSVQPTALQLNNEVNVYGRYIIPPQGAFSVLVMGPVAGVVNPTGARPLVSWFEAQFPIG